MGSRAKKKRYCSPFRTTSFGEREKIVRSAAFQRTESFVLRMKPKTESSLEEEGQYRVRMSLTIRGQRLSGRFENDVRPWSGIRQTMSWSGRLILCLFVYEFFPFFRLITKQ
ncbi:hypothetical protein AVEN_86811-1 [Araneus ventricosus]|uniref:Uncharacterized protein n=1 Tax=Araneus ventricosus TaxID=182803 RepID=A0A4Y2D2Z5_ARAVE|nr:hypothetical protein AVEN_86811-1 [Araneus ventricosus]